MFGHTFYFDTIRKYVITFGTLFNDIMLVKYNEDGTVAQSLRVPLTYAPRDKMLQRIKQDPDLTKPTAVVLPRMSFALGNIQYDRDRHLNSVQRVVVTDPNNVNKFRYQYNPVPYNFDFSLFVYVRNAEDGTKIVEQILPFFGPDFSVRLELIADLAPQVVIPIVHKDTRQTDLFEGDFLKVRTIVWELNFTLKGYLYGPVKRSPIVKFSNTNLHIGLPEETESIVDVLTVTPGLLPNGSPTVDANNSISPLLIDIEDDWDYAVQMSGIVIELE